MGNLNVRLLVNFLVKDLLRRHRRICESYDVCDKRVRSSCTMQKYSAYIIQLRGIHEMYSWEFCNASFYTNAAMLQNISDTYAELLKSPMIEDESCNIN